MHTVVLTELGIAVYQDDAKLYSIPFENPAEEYVAIKQQKSIPADLATRLITRADDRFVIVSAASIIAKVSRDRAILLGIDEAVIHQIQRARGILHDMLKNITKRHRVRARAGNQ